MRASAGIGRIMLTVEGGHEHDSPVPPRSSMRAMNASDSSV
jgi:hypothetical protein